MVQGGSVTRVSNQTALVMGMYQRLWEVNMFVAFLSIRLLIPLVHSSAVVELNNTIFKKDVLGSDNTYFVSFA
jgi:hypothetical protein